MYNDISINNHFTVYMHVNKVNQKKYIGITGCNPKDRWMNGSGYFNQPFGEAIKKYGWNNFDHIILYEHLSEKEALLKEEELISSEHTLLNENGYNVLKSDVPGHFHATQETKDKISNGLKLAYKEGRMISHSRDPEVRKKISENNKGKIAWNKGLTGVQEAWNKGIPMKEESKKKLSKSLKGNISWNTGIPWDDEVRRKFSENRKGQPAWNKGIKATEEQKKKSSESHKGKQIGLNNPYSKPIKQISTGLIFGSMKEAIKELSIGEDALRAKCKKGIEFKYLQKKVYLIHKKSGKIFANKKEAASYFNLGIGSINTKIKSGEIIQKIEIIDN